MTEIVVEDRTNTDGSRYLTAVGLDKEGNLYFRGYDSGPTVRSAFGHNDYEYSHIVAAADVPRILLELLRERFNSSGSAFSSWVKEHDVHVGFDWWLSD